MSTSSNHPMIRTMIQDGRGREIMVASSCDLPPQRRTALSQASSLHSYVSRTASSCCIQRHRCPCQSPSRTAAHSMGGYHRHQDSPCCCCCCCGNEQQHQCQQHQCQQVMPPQQAEQQSSIHHHYYHMDSPSHRQAVYFGTAAQPALGTGLPIIQPTTGMMQSGIGMMQMQPAAGMMQLPGAGMMMGPQLAIPIVQKLTR
eukprot:Protomagalhaensia_sp_Gyna_25__2113@NODE_2141_length_1263_cov_7_159314_g1769_i0_p1_GENE_NODE_2141_length_1263_cov_7_159314_g1769_i0NODE_2141_length_1263_cov_7_159314_g1769_i0_p1_ORF_typecomplete_len200_score26_10DUF4452/PF14618_6/1_2e03DUF4452/PF14618_6/0_087_NODE_2141_length_1263_cov_7_159314_g1769_i05421141